MILTANIILENNLQLELKDKYLHSSMKKYVRYTDDNMHCLAEEKMQQSLIDAKDVIKNFNYIWIAMLRNKTYDSNLRFKENINCTSKWSNGLLTNFEQIKKILNFYNENKLKNNFESTRIKNRMNKLNRLYSLINFVNLPDLLFCSDTVYSVTARNEAKRLNIPVMSLVDSQSDIKDVDFPIFVNTRSKKSVNFVILYLMDATLENLSDENLIKQEE